MCRYLPPCSDTETPTVPENLDSPLQTGSTLELGWVASSDDVGVTAYRIYQNGAPIGTSGSATYTAQGLSPSTRGSGGGGGRGER